MTIRVLIDGVAPGGRPRGVGRYVVALANAMSQLDDIEVFLAAAPWQMVELEREIEHRVDLVEARPVGSGRVGRHLWHRFALGGLARHTRVDLIHLPDTIPPPGTALPIVATVHDLAEFDLPTAYGRVQQRYRRAIARKVVAQAARIITVSAFSAERITSLLGGGKDMIHVIPNGPGITPATIGSRSPSVGDSRFVLFVGGLNRNKNLERIVAGFAGAGREGVDLVIAGPPGNDRLTVIEAVEGSAHIRWLDKVDDTELAWLYGHAAALVFPSLYEGFGLPIVEAMAFGTPVITSRSGAVAEVAGDAALLVDPLDTAAIGQAISAILDDGGLAARLSRLGRERAAAFTWAGAAQATIEVYRAAIGQRPLSQGS